MSIFPLPVFEADADPRHRGGTLTDEEVYAALAPPTSIVVRFGSMKLVAELPYEGDAKPGCGSKLVARTHRGTEIVEMLTTTCENAGCSKSVTRQEMREYIDSSGGPDYPFHNKGKVLRVAGADDLAKQAALQADKRRYVSTAKRLIAEMSLPMKLVDVEPILGEELLTFYFMSEDRVDFRELVRLLAAEFKTRIEMRQVGARDEARLVADYERCGQHCCCKSFLKVLKPVSMKAAKLQKATLDPLKISGRCGRLMCCLRYEDQTYRELKRNLPARNTRVGTTDGPGLVVDSKVLVQLVLVRLEDADREIAVPVEELLDPDTCPRPLLAPPPPPPRPERPARPERPERPAREAKGPPAERRPPRPRRGPERRDAPRPADAGPAPAPEAEAEPEIESTGAPRPDDGSSPPQRRKRRRRRRGRGPRAGGGGEGGAPP